MSQRHPDPDKAAETARLLTKRSGKTCVVVMRYAAQQRLRQAVFHWARAAVQNVPKSQVGTKPCAHAGIPTAVPCAVSPTGCSALPASCCNGRTVHRRARHDTTA